MELFVELGKDRYPIYIKKGILKQLDSYIEKVYKGKKIVIITDDHVSKYYLEDVKHALNNYEVHEIIIPHGETSKQFSILPSIYKQLLEFGITRTDLIIALGGGVIGDLAGFVASTYLRGLKFIQIPTSLLAQVDSSVGGKVAVDLPEGKNLVGAFKHPLMVFIDPNTLKTLDEHYIIDGMGEVIKYGCIKDKVFFDRLNHYQSFDELYEDIDEIIKICVSIKKDVVEKDLYDFNDRLCLNFGHTIGHAIEQYYHFEKYSHGEAVALGMLLITKLSILLGKTNKNAYNQIKECLSHYGLPTEIEIDMKDLISAVKRDKKNINSHLSYVFLKDIGEYFIYQDSPELLLKIGESQ